MGVYTAALISLRDVTVLQKDSIICQATRRSFLRSTLALSAAALKLPAHASPQDTQDPVPAEPPTKDPLNAIPIVTEPDAAEPIVVKERKLRLFNVHTQERLDVVYWRDNRYIDDHVGQLNYFMRDHRANKSALMDKKLYDQLHRLYGVLNTDAPIHVLSAYRTAATNTALRKRSSAVAKNSFHVKGRAVDIYIPGTDNKILQREARRLMQGGVGYYLKAGFVHLDTGYPRHWVNS